MGRQAKPDKKFIGKTIKLEDVRGDLENWKLVSIVDGKPKGCFHFPGPGYMAQRRKSQCFVSVEQVNEQLGGK